MLPYIHPASPRFGPLRAAANGGRGPVFAVQPLHQTQEAQMKRIQVTVWQSPEEVIETAHGPMPFGIWLALEHWRFTRAGHRATIIGRPDRRIALFRWPVRRRPAAARPPQGKDTAESFPCAAR